MEELRLRDVVLPGGHVIKAESAVDTRDMMRGLMFRNSLAPDHGMLFVHPVPGHYSYWMYQTFIPLDIIWMDENRRIVEIVESAPPCKTAASQCGHFGGTQMARFVLELNGGEARKYGLKLGDGVDW